MQEDQHQINVIWFSVSTSGNVQVTIQLKMSYVLSNPIP